MDEGAQREGDHAPDRVADDGERGTLRPTPPGLVLGWALAALAFLEMSLLLLRPDGKESDAPRLSGPHLVERIDLFAGGGDA